ncbi:hypothetical protein VOLCADRAFT_86069 [Volvox carteri f. nagariensis]|uniref:F5/8 type C domain-containing protein n=1 Tax=Volvox carteri f. nagariensis TaxID=3068 RepID=D8THS3_VOLCA|nr:uncharacterized protein VOLCADRAFT_86069 [Volvox carteri f. nagariensis]EFJ53116.1 hypothetical protein VOLCADRAFT_86069 [Volvox carteri f. nagariensis]|eukprot:XP_002946121.1 hypothetical protein VOLCADRAFT_86069 [Volvox carteri f. nagariensis]
MVAGPLNLALNKQVYASSYYSDTTGPTLAVNGDKTSIFQSGFNDTTPWLSIDLGAIYSVSKIVIYNRQDCCGSRLYNAEVRVGVVPISALADGWRIPENTLVWTLGGAGTTGAVYTIKLSPPYEGRWVTLQNKGGDFLHITEMEVY